MHDRHAREMRAYDLVHLRVGSNFEECRQIRLDFGQRTASRHFEYEGCVAEQRTVLDRRDVCVRRALDQLETDGAAIEPRAEEVLNVAQHRGKYALEIVVVVDAVFARPPLVGRKGRKLAGNAQQRLIQALGMDVAGRTKVFEGRNFAIEALKHEVVAALKAAARGRVACVPSEFVELVSNPADDAVEPALNGWMCGADKNW